MTIQGVSWARLIRDDEMARPGEPGIGWHLWRRKSHFPYEDMGVGFRYLASEGPADNRSTESIHKVTDFMDFRWVDSVPMAYGALRRRFGMGRVGTRLEWLDNPYNREKTDVNRGAIMVVAWVYTSRRIDPVELGDFAATRTGWKRLP
mgnify:CR=1 FL=1